MSRGPTIGDRLGWSTASWDVACRRSTSSMRLPGPRQPRHFFNIAPDDRRMPLSIPSVKPIPRLPPDQRVRQGGWLFLGTLFVFFISGLLLFAVYAWSRRNDPQTAVPLPPAFYISTACLILVSGLVHAAVRTVRRSKRYATAILLGISAVAATIFMWIQYVAMADMLDGPALQAGTGKGVAGMVAVLAFLHALHVAGGVIALAIVAVRAMTGKYDHERYWPVEFSAHYWHFLDVVWLFMLATFMMTTGGFG